LRLRSIGAACDRFATTTAARAAAASLPKGSAERAAPTIAEPAKTAYKIDPKVYGVHVSRNGSISIAG
jgi:hypothetical protein